MLVICDFENYSKRVTLPGAICILHPDSCCMREICSPPLPITSEKKENYLLEGFKVYFEYVFSKLQKNYLLNPTIPSGTLYSSVITDLLRNDRN